MKVVGDAVKMRCQWGELPALNAVIALVHKRTGEVTRKMQVRSIRGRSVHMVIVPLDTPHSETWERAPRSKR